jgi:hypothetical protein
MTLTPGRLFVIRAMTAGNDFVDINAVSWYLPPTIMPANRTRIFSPS